MAYKFTQEVVVVVEICCACGTPFGVEEGLINNYRKNHKTFYCPNGHGQSYGESQQEIEIKELKNKLEDARNNASWWKSEANLKAKQLSATKGVLTKTKNRLAHGVCPCCNRHFPDDKLQRHIATKHPEYTKEEA